MSYILAKPIYIFLWNEKKTTLNIYEQNQRVLYLSALDSKSDKTEAYGLISEAVANRLTMRVSHSVVYDCLRPHEL